jgi:serine/threonine-protein kinase
MNPRVEPASIRMTLEVLEGPLRGRSFVLNGPGESILGRSRLVDLPLTEDAALSREHFVIRLRPTGAELLDMQSTNGTYVNQQKITRTVLVDGDLIAAGQSLLQVHLSPGPAKDAGQGRRPVRSATTKGTAEYDVGAMLSSRDELAAVVCNSCGLKAPPSVIIAQDNTRGGTDSIHWLCDHCREEVALTPQLVPHYTTLRVLGKGAMGVVYLAQDKRDGRKVALKLIVPESAAARSAIDRFLREMTVISQLKHPNIVEWLEQGTTGGQFWFAMEFVEGSNLEALAQAALGRYPIDQACRMACQVLKGLDHAHSRGFVHRDIKPENILIGRNAENLLVAKISDFGLAKSYRSIGLSGLTFSGEMRGTIPFMPPEQMLDFKKVLPSGDLYSTAATLYYLLSGHFIYEEKDEGIDVVRLVLEERPVPIRDRRAEIPAGLAAVIDRGLARDPEDRFPTAAALRKALRAFC